MVKDEKHFLLHCPMSKELREKCLPIEILNDNVLSDNEKFTNIMTNSVLIQSTAKFVYEAFKNRDLCLEVLNTINDVTECVEDICLKTQHEDSVIMPYKIQSQSGLKLILFFLFIFFYGAHPCVPLNFQKNRRETKYTPSPSPPYPR